MSTVSLGALRMDIDKYSAAFLYLASHLFCALLPFLFLTFVKVSPPVFQDDNQRNEAMATDAID